MRDIDSVVIKKAILHVLDRNADGPILTDYEQEIDEDIHEFLERHIVKSLNCEDNRTAKFKGGDTAVREAVSEIMEKGNFIEASQRIAERLFKSMKTSNLVSSGDLVICFYTAHEKEYIAILKLDYRTSYIHNVTFQDDKLKNEILPQHIGLPGTGQKLQQCAFIKAVDEDADFDLIVLDNMAYADEDAALYFTHTFLNCEVLVDDREKTRAFRNITEKWTRKNLKEDFEKAQEVREEMATALKHSAEIDIEKFTQNVFGTDIDMAQNFIQHFFKEGLNADRFEIDKRYVEKKMKRKTMKTDTGIEIKGDYEDFEDRMKFEIKRNGDGTVDLVIKNVRSLMEK
ncbi:nucleoid-associated protein YejK [Anaerosolibacter carboniphilus]|uniref:Nucleoid-associated protein YejK n=1 Tax=Anaerosolibacter carboniphilus TaxID=1417629 RepID=A0A841KXN4_9FIRM|nr:nucleoid-associated protein [Anaerosolibacter carboniphilus]MBB6218211.1 nucleoid-associated protein YejK [Anaerosolibacter carboniphilus]